MQPSLVVKASVLTNHRHNALRSRNGSARSLTMPCARRNVEQMCIRMSPGTAGGHHPLPICGTGGKTITRRSFNQFL